jgi:hypothetical protein
MDNVGGGIWGMVGDLDVCIVDYCKGKNAKVVLASIEFWR